MHKLTGETLSTGQAIGHTILISNLNDYPKVKKGDIIVTELPSPLMNPILTRAAGIIVEKGGLLSHGAIVARELGIPCIRIDSATTKILNNTLVKLNSKDSTVELIDQK